MSFTPLHLTRSRVIRLSADPARVFPLFEPLDEARWAEGWAPQFVHPTSGEACVGMVFTTQHPGETDTTWTIAAYDPERFHITYVRLTPDSRLGVIDVACSAAEGQASAVTITYTFTALGDAGNAYLAAFTTDHYAAYMADWERAINHYLQHGATLRHHADRPGYPVG
jgi:hypothetical protein